MMKTTRSYRTVILLAVACTLCTCTAGENESDNRYLARVGEEYLTVEEARSALSPSLLKGDSLRALRNYREQWIRDRLMVREANRMGLHQNEEVRRKMERARREVLREAIRSQIFQQYGEGAEVTDEEARNYFQTHRDQFILQERYIRFRHMVTRTIQQARSARQELLQGVAWPEVARRYALDPERALGESEQFWPLSMAATENEVMHRYLEVIGQQEISPVRRVDSTYHFVQLMETREEGEQPELDWLISRIKEWLKMEKRRRYFSSYIKNLYLRAESNNEIETFNVLEIQSNSNSSSADTLEENSSNE